MDEPAALILAAENWYKHLANVFNQFTVEVESHQNRLADLSAKRRTPALKAEYLLRVDSFEQTANNSGECLTMQHLLDINKACLRLRCFADPWLEERVDENEAAVALLKSQLDAIPVLNKTDKWIRLVKELVAANIFAWGVEIITEILEHDAESELIELDRLSDDDLHLLIRVINLLGNWIRYRGGYQINKCQKICEVLVKAINRSYWPCTKTSTGCMAALENELAECAVSTLKRIMTQEESEHHPKTAFILIKMLLDSLSGISKAEWREDNKNEDIAVNIYHLIASAANHHSGLMVVGVIQNGTEYSELFRRVACEIFQATTKSGAYPVDELCSNEAVIFWTFLTYHVYETNNEENKKKFIDKLNPVYIQITKIILKKAQHPEQDVCETWSENDWWNFKNYRINISRALISFVDLFEDTVLDILSRFLDENISDLEDNFFSWTKLELCIFAFYSISSYVCDEENEIGLAAKLMHFLMEIPYENLDIRVLELSLKCVEMFRPWLTMNTTYIPITVQLLIKGLYLSTAYEAGVSILDLSTELQVQMSPYAEEILGLYNTCLFSGRLKDSDANYLMSSVGKLISVLPTDKIYRHLNLIVNRYFDNLEGSLPIKSITVLHLNLISSVFKTLNTKVMEYDRYPGYISGIQPLSTILQRKMPLFRRTVEFWKDDDEVIEGICGTLCNALTNLQLDFKRFLEEFCCFMMFAFKRKPRLVVFRVSKECFRVFGCDSKRRMQQLICGIVQYSFQFFEETSADEFKNIVNVVGEFRDWIMYLIEIHLDLISEINVDYYKLILYVLQMLILPDYSIRLNTLFLEQFIRQSRKVPGMTQAVLHQGSVIVRTVILGAACDRISKLDVEHLSDVLDALKSHYLHDLVDWFKMFRALNFPTPLILEEDKMKFVAEIIRPNTNKFHIRVHMVEFAAKCRGVVTI